jgi:EAL domain-containing protein (putative c-di-GMP-specific phosphodiesterase class I)/DNA-binding NarL/FixJ family response regulator
MTSSMLQSAYRRHNHPVAAAHGRITVLIADDEPLVRTLLADCIRLEPLLEVVGLAGSADEAIQLAHCLRPDVALLDFSMPGGGELAARGILEWSSSTRIVAFSGSDDRTTVLDMLRAGAASYLVKGAHPDQIIETVLCAARGASILSAEVASGVIGELTAHLERRDVEESASRLLVDRIHRVIDEHLFGTVFQPIVDLREGRAVGIEALSRFFAEPVQGPDRWFADAELAGLRTELELAAARAALTHLSDIAGDMFLSLNLSPATLTNCGPLFDDADGRQLVVEITEHAAIDDYDALASYLAPVRDRGTRVAVDDAGAGFASLRHALQLSPDFIKLDVSLTRGIDSDRRRHALAAGLIGFANELGAAVVAEGIETRAELDTARELGVQYGQGYFIAAPGPLTLGNTQLSHMAG